MNADMFMFVAACAACKHLGEKCDANCQLFGVDNIIKLLNSVPDDQKEKTAETLILEAKIRKENPVHGCLAIERKLGAEIEAHEKELEMIQNHISLYKKMATLQMEEQQSEEELDRSSLALVSPSDAHFSMPGDKSRNMKDGKTKDVSPFYNSVQLSLTLSGNDGLEISHEGWNWSTGLYLHHKTVQQV
ncbi:LOB domain-containing protein 21-like [Lycium ferocissimum]|uniref:LOB domain-containing protein 21-like n=1 Tax=Lycium ferocissimum TaxID=112874 RepID=UPI0028166E9C|nr:LOB domain-containing protein 21-like [Lycium ferocissimum]